MKIKYLYFTVLLSLASMTSCMKEYGCTCNNIITEGEPADSTWTRTTTVTNNNKKDAEANCEYLGGTSYSGQTVVEETCTLD